MIMAHAQPTAKAGWKQTTLKDSTDLITCGVAARPEYVENGIPFLSAKNVKHGEVIWHDHKFVSLETHEKLTKHNKPQKGDILYTRVGSFGEAAIIDSDIEFSIFVSLTLIKPKDFLLNTFLKYYLNSPHIKSLASRSISGSGVGNLNVGTVRKFPIPVPPLAEQERIVGILDEAFEGIAAATAQAEKNLHNARELFQSVLQSTFSPKGDDWVEKTLKEMAKEFGRGKSKHRPRNADFLYGGQYPFVQTGDIRNSDHLITKYSQTYSEEGLAQSKLWPEGTVCITIAANIAETGILNFDACFPDSVIGMIPDPEKSIGGYIEYLLQFFKVELQRQGKGSAQDNINLGTFKDQTFPFAPVNKQQAIVEKLDALSEETKRLEAIYERKQAALSELKQSLLQKAFAGEL